MGYFSELDLELRNAADRQRYGIEEDIDLDAAAALLGGEIDGTFIRCRALTLPIPPALQFHSLLKHSPTGSWWPAMVAERADVTGNVVAIHRTYLQHAGSGKAPIEPQRMDLGPVRGTAIRLSPPADEL